MNFKKHNKWIEYSIIRICSPMEFMLEGTAVYNLDLIFPMNERIDFGIKLADLAGLDSSMIELYFKVCQHLYKLRFMAYGEVAQEYLDGAKAGRLDHFPPVKWTFLYLIRDHRNNSGFGWSI